MYKEKVGVQMRNEPMNQISPKGLKVWRLYGVIHSAVILINCDRCWSIKLVAGRSAYGYYLFVFCVLLLYTYIFVYLFPKLRWFRWRYEVREQEIELQHGLFIVKRSPSANGSCPTC